MFTVESYARTSKVVMDSDPVYVEIGEVLEDKSEAAVDSQDIHSKYSEENENLKNIFATKGSVTHSNSNLVYGRIVGKEVAKYAPSSPLVIRR